MKLNIDFDDDLIKKYVERGRSPIFSIYWTQDQVAYPEKQWLDFGSVILSWWLVAAKSLLDGATEADFLFMDGPFRLHVRLIGNLLYVTPDDDSWQWRIATESFVAELLTAANRVQSKFAELGLSDTEGFQIGIQHLKVAMSQAMTTVPRNHALVAELVTH